MIALWISAGLVLVAILAAVVRMSGGPDDANRVLGADLLFFGTIALLAIGGTALSLTGTFDLVVVATAVGFLAAVSLARALTRGKR